MNDAPQDLGSVVRDGIASRVPGIAVRVLPEGSGAERGLLIEPADARAPHRSLKVLSGTDFDAQAVFVSFEGNGVGLAEAYLNSLDEVSDAARAWMIERRPLEQLEGAVPGLRCVDAAQERHADAAGAVAQAWERVWRFVDDQMPELRHVVELARAHPVLGRLYAFLSLKRLCFSRCTQFPFTGDVLAIRARYRPTAKDDPMGEQPVQPPTFLVFDRWDQVQTEGDAETVVRFVAERVPANTASALAGNARDIEY